MNFPETTNEFFHINYEMDSYLGDSEGMEYINEVTGAIYVTNGLLGDEQIKQNVGAVSIQVFLIGEAINNSFPLFQIFDNPKFLWEEGFEVFDTDTASYTKEIDEFYGGVLDSNICLVNDLVLQPQYRGRGVGKLIIKDIYTRFGVGCGLFIVDASPLQHKYDDLIDFTDYELDKFTDDQQLANDKLQAYFLSLGFDKILNNSLLFNAPHLKNILFEMIVRE